MYSSRISNWWYLNCNRIYATPFMWQHFFLANYWFSNTCCRSFKRSATQFFAQGDTLIIIVYVVFLFNCFAIVILVQKLQGESEKILHKIVWISPWKLQKRNFVFSLCTKNCNQSLKFLLVLQVILSRYFLRVKTGSVFFFCVRFQKNYVPWNVIGKYYTFFSFQEKC